MSIASLHGHTVWTCRFKFLAEMDNHWALMGSQSQYDVHLKQSKIYFKDHDSCWNGQTLLKGSISMKAPYMWLIMGSCQWSNARGQSICSCWLNSGHIPQSLIFIRRLTLPQVIQHTEKSQHMDHYCFTITWCRYTAAVKVSYSSTLCQHFSVQKSSEMGLISTMHYGKVP